MNPEAIFARDKSGRTILATQKSVDIIKYVFSVAPAERHVSLFESDKSGSSALFHTQCDKCLVFLVTKAKEIGVDPLNSLNDKGQNVLFLIKEGIDTKCVDVKGRTPLFFANAHLTKWLLDENPSAVGDVDEFGSRHRGCEQLWGDAHPQLS